LQTDRDDDGSVVGSGELVEELLMLMGVGAGLVLNVGFVGRTTGGGRRTGDGCRRGKSSRPPFAIISCLARRALDWSTTYL
jgi:hypothetical protein